MHITCTVTNKARWIVSPGLVLFALLISGCSSTATKEAGGPLFYPPLPNPPRIQFLKTFSNRGDLGQSGSRLSQWILGKEELGAELVKKPYGVGIHNGSIFVVDTRGPGYAVFDMNTGKFKFVQGSMGGVMKKPINIAFDRIGYRYVTDTIRGQVLVYDLDDRFIRAYGIQGQFRPSDVAVHGDYIYVADLEHHQVAVLDRQSGKEVRRIGSSGSGKDQLYHPTNLTIGADNHLYVSDTSNFRIQKYTLDGKYVRSFGSIGSGLGKFARPKGVAVDRQGNLYVVDAAFENVQVLNPEGKLLLFFGQAGDRRGDINLPTAVVIDYDNVELFKQFADPRFELEYLILVASQFGANKVNVYGYGHMQGMDYGPSSGEGRR